MVESVGKQSLKNRIVFIPLDERPCNYSFPYEIFKKTNLEIIRPEISLMGYKKTPAKYEVIKEFLLKETKEAFGLVIAIDTLLYGGIIPSRLHYYDEVELEKRLDILKEIKKNNPHIIIYAYHLIMRTPGYNSNDEEPDYYQEYGRNIFKTGFLGHKLELEIASKEEKEEYNNLFVPKEYLEDFLKRRKINLNSTRKSIELTNDKIINFLIIPQDDSATHGFTAKDQDVIKNDIYKYKLENDVYMYPGADEVANVLMARFLNKVNNKTPKLYLKYNSLTAPKTIPSLEDRYLDLTIRSQILATGSLVTTSVKEADVVLYINAPSDQMITAPYQFELKGKGFNVERNMPEFIESLKHTLYILNKPVILADLAFGNGGDVELLRIINKEKLLMDLASYSGWNTSANALGTALGQGLVFLLYGNTKNHKDFLTLRYVEDVGYCALTRRKVTENFLALHGFNYFDVLETHGLVSKKVFEELSDFIKKELTSISDNIVLEEVYMPWKRMYEVGIKLRYEEKMR